MQMVTKKISARFPAELLEKMDLVASMEHMDRTELMKQAIREFLKDAMRDPGVKGKVVEFYLEGRLSYKKLEIILGKEDAAAARASRELMKQGAALARKLA